MPTTLHLESPAPGIQPFETARVCARPDCDRPVADGWDERGRLCAECAVQEDLSDRVLRWARVYPC